MLSSMHPPSRKLKVRFHVGGPEFHPVAAQADMITDWLGEEFICTQHHDKEIFDVLDDADLVVFMGLFTTHVKDTPYAPLTPEHESVLARYVAGGKPVLLHHGAAASYDESEVFKRYLGINWVWEGERPSLHSPIGDYHVEVASVSHPVTEGVSSFDVFDELYFDLVVRPGVDPVTLAFADYEGREFPMVQVLSGGRSAGAGELVYLINGHDLRAFKAPAMRTLWCNSIRWLTRNQ